MAIFCQINQKNLPVDPNVLYSFDGYQKKGIDPNISGKKSLAQLNIRISSYCRFKMSAYKKQVENLSFINLDLCGKNFSYKAPKYPFYRNWTGSKYLIVYPI